MISDEDYFYHNFQDQGNALQLWTNSQIGAEDKVCVHMRKDEMALYDGLNLCIYFGDELMIVVKDYSDNRCNPNIFTVRRYSNTNHRKWSIVKSPKSFEISGDDFEPFSMDFDELDCGNLAKSIKFGWMQFFIKLSGVSSAFYAASKGNNLQYCNVCN